MPRAVLSWCLAFAALAHVGQAHAEAAADQPLSSLTQEWVGLELSPLSLNSGGPPFGPAPTRVQPGPGGTIRVLRHRWPRAYWTPLQAGIFLGETSRGTIFAHAEMEGGAIIPVGPQGTQGKGTGRALEIGMAAGVGVLAVEYAQVGCDGSCDVGGAGVMFSPVVRYLFRDGPGWTMGATVRAAIPLHVPSGDWFGHYSGRAILYLVGFDVALGR